MKRSSRVFLIHKFNAKVVQLEQNFPVGLLIRITEKLSSYFCGCFLYTCEYIHLQLRIAFFLLRCLKRTQTMKLFRIRKLGSNAVKLFTCKSCNRRFFFHPLWGIDAIDESLIYHCMK